MLALQPYQLQHGQLFQRTLMPRSAIRMTGDLKVEFHDWGLIHLIKEGTIWPPTAAPISNSDINVKDSTIRN